MLIITEDKYKPLESYTELPNVDVMYVDSRDFHTYCVKDIDEDTQKILNKLKLVKKFDEGCVFKKSEILDYLKSLESYFTNKNWIHLVFKDNPDIWRKYLRFYKIGEIDNQNIYICYASSMQINVDSTAYKKLLLNKFIHTKDNIKERWTQ